MDSDSAAAYWKQVEDGDGHCGNSQQPVSPAVTGDQHTLSVQLQEPPLQQETDTTTAAAASPAWVDSASLPRKLTAAIVLASAQAFKPLKPLSTSLLRWSLLWLLLCLAFASLPVYLPFIVGCDSAFRVVVGVLVFQLCVWAVCLLQSLLVMCRVHSGMRRDHRLLYPASWRHFHIIVLTIYRDDMAVVERTLESIAAQTEASRIILNIAWESRTPDIAARSDHIKSLFSHHLALIVFTVHPYGLPHEIASKAANANYGLRHTVQYLFGQCGETDADRFLVTTCDCDTLLHQRYFESLSADYYTMLQRHDTQTHRSIWQAPLLYNWQLHLSSFPVRVTALLRTSMTAGLLIPFSVNPMSCFSFSLPCAVRGGYWHPQIFMDDVGFLMTTMCQSRSNIAIRLLPVPVVSGPTSGATYCQDLVEWYTQVRRWAIGTSDHFHHCIVSCLQMPFLGGLRFLIGYFLYYGFLLCGAALFTALSGVLTVTCGTDGNRGELLLLLAVVLLYAAYAVMFCCDQLWVRWILGVVEPIGCVRNVLHWLSTGPVLIALSCIQLWGYCVVACYGKAACLHRVAGKASLAVAPIRK